MVLSWGSQPRSYLFSATVELQRGEQGFLKGSWASQVTLWAPCVRALAVEEAPQRLPLRLRPTWLPQGLALSRSAITSPCPCAPALAGQWVAQASILGH